VNLKAYNNNIEKLFKVNPGGVPEDIQVQVLGATGLGVTEHGELEIHLQDGAIKMSKPVAFQEEYGKKQEIQVKYTVDGNEYGFEVGKYDQTLPLIIDPFIASTFFGGSGEDQLTSMVIDDEGNIYIAGHTKSADFPNKSDREYTHGDNYFEWDPMGSWWGDDPEPPTRTPRGTTYDVFVSKLNGDMTQLLASTYIGGNENDYAYALTVDDKGNVYVAGRTTSTGIRPYGDDYIEWEGFEYDPDDWEDCWDDYITFEIEPPTAFPTTEGAYQTEPLTDRGFNNYFVTKLDNNLDDIIASTLLGEGTDGTDGINGIKIDSNGDILVVGKTGSLNGFSVSGNPSYEPLYGFTAGDDGKGKNGFIAKFNDSLTEIKGYTFLGGGGILHGAFRDNGTSIEAIVLDNQDNIYITGSTADVNFPTTDDAFCGEHNEKEGNWPGDDAFIAKLNNNLDILISSTLLGGKSSDGGVDIELDTDGSVFITGTTMSEDFPVGSGAYQRNLKKHQSSTYHDIFISRLNNDLSELLAGTYIGGQNREDVFGLALDEGFVYVTGSTMGEYPTTDDSTGRIVISKLNKDLTELEVSTLLGESGDEGRAIIVREDGVYVSGKTSSKNFPVTDGTYRGESGSGGSGACVFITGFAKESSEEDIEPPVWEKGSIPTAENIGLNELTLVWNKGDVTDNVGVTGFRIYQKDGEYGEEVEYDFVTEVDANTTSYVITGLESTTWYKFKVEAVDAAGNESKTDRVLKVMTEIPDLIISIDGVIEEEFLLGDLLEGLEIDKSWPPEETTAPIVRRMYTAANSYGTKRIYAAEGIRISYLIENLDLTDNSLLTFVSSGMSETFTKAQLEESRFYYPEDGEPIAVEPLLAYMSDSPKDGSQPSFDNMGPETGLRLYFGQREQGEMIAPRYLKEVFHIQITQGEPEPEVDKTALQDKVGEVKGYKEEDYTADSWAAFAEALEGAQLVLGDEKATQGEIDNALDVLNEAIENLVHEDIPTQKYELIVEDSDDYEVRETEVGLILTLKQGVTGFKHFEAMVKAIEEKLGQLEVVFTHLRNNMQQSLNSIQADSDADKIDASAGFNIKPGDVIRIYLVDELTNEIDRNPIIFK
ncbi:MAG: SBBP repeat-containing protein, partial [Candidatus Alkaliphilus sp. MAG34]